MKLFLNIILLFLICLSYESFAYTKPGSYSVNNTGLPLLPSTGGASKMEEFECQDCGHFMRVRIVGGQIIPGATQFSDEKLMAYITSSAGRNNYNKFLTDFLEAKRNTDFVIHTVRKGSLAGHNALKSVVTLKKEGSRAYTVHVWMTVSKSRVFIFGVLYFPGTFTGVSVTRFNQMLTSFKLL